VRCASGTSRRSTHGFKENGSPKPSPDYDEGLRVRRRWRASIDDLASAATRVRCPLRSLASALRGPATKGGPWRRSRGRGIKERVQEAVWTWAVRLIVLVVVFVFGGFTGWVMWGPGTWAQSSCGRASPTRGAGQRAEEARDRLRRKLTSSRAAWRDQKAMQRSTRRRKLASSRPPRGQHAGPVPDARTSYRAGFAGRGTGSASHHRFEARVPPDPRCISGRSR